MNADPGWKIGEFAKKTGLTVRTLHHYDQVGLLTPSERTESGHRMYSLSDLRKLLQIVALKRLGLSLEDIRNLFAKPESDPLELLATQAGRLEEQIDELVALRSKVADLHRLLQTGHAVSNELFLAAVQMSPLLHSSHFRSEQIRTIRDRYLSDDEKTSVQELLESFRGFYNEGKPAEDPEVAALAVRWEKEMRKRALTDPSLIEAAERYYREHPEAGSSYGMDGQLYAYIKTAVASIR